MITRRAVAVALVLVVLLAMAASAQPFDDGPATVARIDADDPIRAAIEVSRLRFPDDEAAQSAVIATSEAFADALTGSILTQDAPLLMTPSSELDRGVARELQRAVASGSQVFVLGGAAALSAKVVTDIAALGFGVQRLSGPSRYETAAAIAQERANRGGIAGILIARGDAPPDNATAAWADAITASAVSLPILLSTRDTLHPAAQRFLADKLDAQIVLLGGQAALSDDVRSAIGDMSLATERVAGSTRDGTAAAIAKRFLGVDQDTAGRKVVLFDGYADDGWAFGLAAAALARDEGAPLLPVNTEAVAEATARVVGCGATVADVLVVGSDQVIPAATVSAHQTCPGSAPGPAPDPAALVLAGDGLLPDAQIGDEPEAAIAAVSAVLGAPSDDTGWIVGCPLDSETDVNERYVDFGDLSLAFYRTDTAEFSSWSYMVPSSLGLQTPRGLGSDATNGDVPGLYPEATFSDDTFGPLWVVEAADGGPFFFFADGPAPTDPLRRISGGDLLFCD